jgi:UDP-N-acetylmuramoyl-tripeptide--D-alanyl-D-alanine ligase
MFELGEEAAAEHLNIIKKGLDTNMAERIFVGKAFHQAGLTIDHRPSTIDSKFYETAEDAIAGLKANPIKNSTILIKGSRGMALERLVELL